MLRSRYPFLIALFAFACAGEAPDPTSPAAGRAPTVVQARPAFARLAREAGGFVSSIDAEGMPQFIWAVDQKEAQPTVGAREAAEYHLSRYAPAFGLKSSDLKTADLRFIRDMQEGGWLAKWKQKIGGVEVYPSEVIGPDEEGSEPRRDQRTAASRRCRKVGVRALARGGARAVAGGSPRGTDVAGELRARRRAALHAGAGDADPDERRAREADLPREQARPGAGVVRGVLRGPAGQRRAPTPTATSSPPTTDASSSAGTSGARSVHLPGLGRRHRRARSTARSPIHAAPDRHARRLGPAARRAHRS